MWLTIPVTLSYPPPLHSYCPRWSDIQILPLLIQLVIVPYNCLLDL